MAATKRRPRKSAREKNIKAGADSKQAARGGVASGSETEAEAPDGVEAPQTNPSQQSLPDPGQVLGQVAWLMMQSPAHKHMFLADLEWLVLPAIDTAQCRIFHKDGAPHAYILWAYMDEESLEDFLTRPKRIKKNEWTCGDRPVVVDFICLGEGADKILTYFCSEVINRDDVVIPGISRKSDGKD